MVSLENRVVIVTGGGRGIGREHALYLAKHGALVVVNDLGGSTDGSGSDQSAAEQVVGEIIAAGGTAVSNTDSVTDFDGAKSIVQTALDAFGDLHGVVNNAGILRDHMLVSMTEEDFDLVVAVHLKGTFAVSRFAAEYWRDQHKSGIDAPRTIVNTSSAAGLHGNVGQTNYSAAKAGIAAMTIVHSQELSRYNVKVNCIAPIARTRMTMQTPGLSDVMEKAVFDPGNISPLVSYLSADGCEFNGQVFSVYGGSVGIYQGWSIAQEVAVDKDWTLDNFAEAVDKLPREVKVNSQMDAIVKAASS